MNISVYDQIQNLLEETNDAFSRCGTVNADYAEFAMLVFNDFKSLLSRPSLTQIELKRMLRQAMHHYKETGDKEAVWASFMAKQIYTTSNENQQLTVLDTVALEGTTH